MQKTTHNAGLFPALLKHWRGMRGMSQLDLALAADVSSRHISFLETARSAPSENMVLQLAFALDVPLRHTNAMLRAAGYTPIYPEHDIRTTPPKEVAQAIQLMKTHHDPFPLIIVDTAYNVLDLNTGAQTLFHTLLPNSPALQSSPLNLARFTFDPKGAPTVVANFKEVGRAFLWRMQREALCEPSNTPLRHLLDEILAMPTVHKDWRSADLTVPSSPTLVIHLQTPALELRFVTMITAFQAPQMVALDELRIEMWLPADEATAQICQRQYNASRHVGE